MNTDDYDKTFSIKKIHARNSKRDKNLLAFEKAHEIRKFEIDLYWKRTAYFWTLIAALFAGYFLLASKASSDPLKHIDLYLTFISLTGYIFSFGWFLVNKGSKFWQENWEFHIDKLEDNITGPLYKTVLCRKDNENKNNTPADDVFSPGSFSVSKINQFIAVYTMILWGGLMIVSLESFWHLLFFSMVLYFVTNVMYKKTRSNIKDRSDPLKIKVIERKATL